MIERYAGQDFVELVFSILLICLILAAGVFVFLWEEDKPTAAPIENITVEIINTTPTPTPEPTLSQEQYMEKFGGLYQGQWLSWKRDNVSGLKDMSVHTTVYDYRIFGTVHWRSISWGQYFPESANEGHKFLFVMVNTYSDEGMARMWGINRSYYWVDINGQLYAPSDRLLPEIRIKEFDEIWNLNHVENVKPYGILRTYDSLGREQAEELGWLKAGKLNGWDGYIVYEIPADTKPEDIKIVAQFNHFIDPHWWQLTEPRWNPNN